jgi:hypothetical protein
LEQSLGNYIWLESRGKNIGKWIYNTKWKLILNANENYASIIEH